MSQEHRALGFRPPPGSLAAEAQAAAAAKRNAKGYSNVVEGEVQSMSGLENKEVGTDSNEDPGPNEKGMGRGSGMKRKERSGVLKEAAIKDAERIM